MTGASVAAMLCTFGGGSAAWAGQPPLFSAGWLAQKGSVTSGGDHGSAGGTSFGRTLTPQQAEQKAAQAIEALSRAAQELASANAAQKLAQQQALLTPGTVPNGLVAGGLVPDSGLAKKPKDWTGATLIGQTKGAGGTTEVTIDQTQSTALINWQSFNIGAKTTLSIDQAGGAGANGNGWVAINRVTGNSAAPSEILGSIKAQGNVYVIDQNGIIFGPHSQVNLQSLVASTLGASPLLIAGNIIKPASGTGGGAPDPAFSVLYNAQPQRQSGDITVDTGAQINAASGGRIFLFGANVENAGSINAPGGQIVLAASSDSVFILPNTDESDTSLRGLLVYADLLQKANGTYVGASVTNDVDGILTATTGNITMIGQSVAQLGIAQATTSVDYNGSIDLLAQFNQQISLDSSGLPTPNPPPVGVASTGTVILGRRSVTEVTDENSEAAAPESQSFTPSSISMIGDLVALVGTATVYTPGGQVHIDATASIANNLGAAAPGLSGSTGDGSRIYIDSGAVIDTAGLENVADSVASQIVAVELRAYELRDSPLQRQNSIFNGLYGQTIYVDTRLMGTYSDGASWVGTPFAHAENYVLEGLLNNIAQLTVAGGDVSLISGQDVILRQGSLVDASGGWFNFTGGTINPTRLVGADGHLYPIGSASAALQYTGICCGYQVAHPQWRVTQSYNNALLDGAYYSPGYLQGEDAGNVYITAPAMALDGQLLGATVDPGPYRRSASNRSADSTGYATTTDVSGVAYWYAAPASATTGVANTAFSGNTIAIGEPNGGVVNSQNTALVDLGSNEAINIVLHVADLPTGFNDTTPLPPGLNAIDVPAGWVDSGGFKNLYVSTNASVTLQTGVTLDLGAGGALSIRNGEQLVIDGMISAPGGTVSLASFDNTILTANLAPNLIADDVVLGQHAEIDLRGLWVNDMVDPDLPIGMIQANGGDLTISAGKGIDLKAGSVIDASGGGWLSAKDKLTAGNGGNISILGNADFSPTQPGDESLYPIILDGSLAAYGVAQESGALPGYAVGNGGTLALELPQLTIGGTSAPKWGMTPRPLKIGGVQTSFLGTEAMLPGSFFSEGGFAQFVITATAGLTIDANTIVAPRLTSLVLTDTIDTLPTQASSANVDGFAIEERLPEITRRPVSLTFKTNFATLTAPQPSGPKGGEIAGADILMEAGAAIDTDAGASVTLQANHQLTIYGSIEAPAGTINLDGAALTTGTAPGNIVNDFDATESVWIAKGAVISTSGTTISYIDPVTGLLAGAVLGGGTISIAAPGGYINVQKGALLDASGGAGSIETLQVVPGDLSLATETPTEIPGNGGTIAVSATSGIFLDGTILAKAGGSTATGGSLFVTLTDVFDGTNGGYNYAYPNSNRKIIVEQDGLSPVATLNLHPGDALDDTKTFGFDSQQPYLQIIEQFGALYGKAFVSADSVMSGGFSALDLAIIQPSGATAGYYVDSSALTNSSEPKLHYYNDSIIFNGSVKLTLAGSITLAAENIGAEPVRGQTAASVEIAAPYVDFAAQSGSDIWGPSEQAGGSADVGGLLDGRNHLVIDADLIDISGVNSIDRFATVLLRSSGDIRLIGGDDLAGQGLLATGALTLDAAQTYTTSSVDIGAALNNTSSAGSYFLLSDTSVTFERNGAVPLPPLSAGGNLTVDAPSIDQDGVLRVPQGSLTLGCFTDCADYQPVTTDLTLGHDSLTSVSLAGVSVPYGTVTNGLVWTAPDGNTLDASPQKILTLDGATIDIAKGAVVDAAGGGDLDAYEFTPGVGGSNDVLAATNAAGVSTIFAILPDYRGSYAPIDPAQTPNDGLTVGEQVYLSGGDGLKAGYYTLLPAHYALLPGAFAISAVSGSTGFLPYQNYVETNGAALLSGYFSVANTPFRAAETEAFQVTPGAVVRTESQFTDYTATGFFPGFAALQHQPTPALPADAGSLVLAPALALSIAGTFDFAPAADGLGGFVSLQAATATGEPGDLAVLGDGEQAPAGYVGVSSAQLSTLDAATLLIGGTILAANSSANSSDIPLYEATAANVLVDNGGAFLRAADIIFLAQDSLTIDAGSRIVAASNGQNPVGGLAQLYGGSSPNPPAFLEVSSGAAATLVNSAGIGGSIHIADGASIVASDSVQLSAGAIEIGGGAGIDAKEIEVTASQIDLGAAPKGANGLLLSGQLLKTLEQADGLILHSLSTINFYGDVTIGAVSAAGDFSVNELTFDTAGLIGIGLDGAAPELHLAAKSLTLTDTDSIASISSAGAKGTLDVVADEITIGGASSSATGVKFAGYASSMLDAHQRIVLSGTGQLAADGNLTMIASSIVAADQSTNPDPLATESNVTTPVDESISAVGALTIERTGSASAGDASDAGATVTFSAASIVDDGRIDLPSGTLSFTASAGGVTFGAGSLTTVAGFQKPFFDVTASAPGGTVAVSASGNVEIDKGALISVAAAADGAEAGAFSVDAAHGQFLLNGALDGAGGGDVSIDAKTLPSFSTLVKKLNEEGFTDDLMLEAAQGDLTLSGSVIAHHFTLAADAGSITVDGTIDAASASDGEIALYAKDDLTLASGARLIATSSATVATAGSVILATTSGAIDAVSGATIDVAGGGYVDGIEASGAARIVSGGTVLLRAPQTGDGGRSDVGHDDGGNSITVGNAGNVGDNVAIDPIGAKIEGARNVTVEAFLPYAIDNAGGKDALIGSGLENAVRADAALFMKNATAIEAALGEANNPLFTLSPGIEIDATGNLFLVADWDLHTLRYGSQGTWPGVLSLRAGGDLTLQANLSDGFTGTPVDDPTGILVATPSWSYRLIAGADLAAADPTATKAGSTGDFELAINPYSAADNQPAAIGGDDETMYVVRSGTGFIDVAAARDIKIDGDIDYPVGGYANALNTFSVLNIGGSSAIYTVGMNTGGVAGFVAPAAGDYPVNPLAEINGQIVYDPVYYTANGGDISLKAGRNIVGPDDTTGPGTFENGANQFIYQWFYTEGSAASAVPPTWWTDFAQFQQGVGALGGGNINVVAGGDIDFLGFAIPTSGRVFGGLNAAGTYNAANLVVEGAGDLYVSAGGNLQDDLFFVGQGKGTIDVGKNILAPIDTSATQSGSDASFGTSIALGDAEISVVTGGNMVLSQIFDPTAAFSSDGVTNSNSLPNPPDPDNPNDYGNDSEIVNYTGRSSLSFQALGGSINYLGNNPAAFDGGPFNSALMNFGGFATAGLNFLPGTASFTAFSGDVTFSGSATLTPDPEGQLNVLAAGAVILAGDQPTAIVQLGISQSAIPGIADPATPADGGLDPLAAIVGSSEYDAASAVPITETNHVYALSEDIWNEDTSNFAGDFAFSKPSEVEAGRDIIDVGIVGQNLSSLDVTSVIAGRDIIYDVIAPTGYNYTTPILGDYTKLGADDIYGFQLGGPGVFDVEAGRNIELAGSNGIETYGNSINSYLPVEGASIVAIAGGVPNYTAFIKQYINPATATGDDAPIGELATFLTNLLGRAVDDASAWKIFAALPLDDQAEFARQIYFEILRDTADPTSINYKKYQNGYAAASVLFPHPTKNASLDLFYSEIETQDGGGIQIFTPGGGIQVGLTDQPTVSGTTELSAPLPVLKTASQLGIFTVNGGAIDSYSEGSVEVNLSRIFTDDGGDLILWSTDGDIDAGKGAKTALSAPPPIEEIDAAGNVVSIPAGAATGSGIAILAPPGKALFNSAYLIAPNGTIDAGDAGLRATGNINVVAERVVNASNIQAGGAVSGVPQTPQIALSALNAASSAANAAENAGGVTDEERKKRGEAHRVPSIITVSVLGFGEPDAQQRGRMSQ